MKILPLRLKELRNTKTTVEIAEVFGVTQPAWTQWERGLREPRLDMIMQICQHFNVSADWLLGLSEERNPARGGVSVSASHSAVAINGHANTVNNCQDCDLMKAALKAAAKALEK